MIRPGPPPAAVADRNPRASGDDPCGCGLLPRRRRRVNPARAGMILGQDEHHQTLSGKPRASGDDPIKGHQGHGVVR